MVLSRTGDSLVWVEDVHLLIGETTFVGDGAADAVVAHYVTSTIAHAEIVSIDTTDAVVEPGVVAVVTGADLAAAGRPLHVPGHSARHLDFS